MLMHIKMLFHHASCIKRHPIRLVLPGLALIYYLHWRFSFDSDFYHSNPRMDRNIRRNYPLPQTMMPTVKMVHFMHRNHLILPEYKPFISSWRRVYPNYKLYFWTDVDIERLVTTVYPNLINFYKGQLTNPLERSDFARVLILHAFGGWYADLDAGCQLSAENLTNRHSLIVPLEPFVHALVAFNKRRLVNNAIMYSTPGHPFWMFLINQIVDRVSVLPKTPRKNPDAVLTTGPLTMTKAMEQYASAYAISCGDLREGLGKTFGCPYVPLPRRFLPLIDNSSDSLASWAKIMCRTVLWESDIIEECQRLRALNFVNALPADAYTYHAFMHLTGARQASLNVSSLGLNILLNPMEYLTPHS